MITQTQTQSEWNLNTFPEEILLQTFSHLTLCQLTRMQSVCRRWLRISRDEHLCISATHRHIRSGKAVNKKTLGCYLDRFAFNPEGTVIHNGRFQLGIGFLSIWNIREPGDSLVVEPIHRSEMEYYCSALSQDGSTLVAVSSFFISPRSICLWDVSTGEKKGEFRDIAEERKKDSLPIQIEGTINAVALYSDHPFTVLAATVKNIYKIDLRLQRAELFLKLEESPSSYVRNYILPTCFKVISAYESAFNPQRPVSGQLEYWLKYEKLRLTDANGQSEYWPKEEFGSLLRRKSTFYGGDDSDMGLSPNGLFLALFQKEGSRLVLWNTATKRKIFNGTGLDDNTMDIWRYAPNSKFLAVAHQIEKLGIIPLDSHGENLSYHSLESHEKDSVSAMTFSPDSLNLAVGYDSGRVAYYDLVSQALLCYFDKHKKRISHIAFSQSGEFMAVSGPFKGTIIYNFNPGNGPSENED